MEDLVLSCLESRVEEHRNLYARFLVGPFLKGDALTIATALRRVLLSSIESIGITALYIQGITHEFSTVLGVRESVLELSLNFQDIVLSYDKTFFQKKSFFDTIQIGYLQVQGPKVIYANHLKLPLGVKLVDPTQYIATVSKEGSLVLKFIIGKRNNFFHQNTGPESHFGTQANNLPITEKVSKKNIVRAKKTCFYKRGSTINWLAFNLAGKAWLTSTSTNRRFVRRFVSSLYKYKSKPLPLFEGFGAGDRSLRSSDASLLRRDRSLLQSKSDASPLFYKSDRYLRFKGSFASNFLSKFFSRFCSAKPNFLSQKGIVILPNLRKKATKKTNFLCEFQKEKLSFLSPSGIVGKAPFGIVTKAKTPFGGKERIVILPKVKKKAIATKTCNKIYKPKFVLDFAQRKPERYRNFTEGKKESRRACTSPNLRFVRRFVSPNSPFGVRRRFVLERSFAPNFLPKTPKGGKEEIAAEVKTLFGSKKGIVILPKVKKKTIPTKICTTSENHRNPAKLTFVYKFPICKKKPHLLKKMHNGDLKQKKNYVNKKKFLFLSNKSNVFKSNICLRNVIPLDFTLTPILKVNFVVQIDDEVLYLRQKVRERIILEVWTNGSIHPRQAVHDAALCLTDTFASFRSVYQVKP